MTAKPAIRPSQAQELIADLVRREEVEEFLADVLFHLSGTSLRVKLRRVARPKQARTFRDGLGRDPLPLSCTAYERGLVSRPVVQRGWITIGPIGPDKGAHLRVNAYLIEEFLIPQRSE